LIPYPWTQSLPPLVFQFLTMLPTRIISICFSAFSSPAPDSALFGMAFGFLHQGCFFFPCSFPPAPCLGMFFVLCPLPLGRFVSTPTVSYSFLTILFFPPLFPELWPSFPPLFSCVSICVNKHVRHPLYLEVVILHAVRSFAPLKNEISHSSVLRCWVLTGNPPSGLRLD